MRNKSLEVVVCQRNVIVVITIQEKQDPTKLRAQSDFSIKSEE